ncbi:MAG TPA: thiamine pyrophosphate-dependent enzyme [Nitrososphaerales archaeon]|nr:thiamine pyrophosphate-dependent enzyme [Nitrososphaerales archaeon]
MKRFDCLTLLSKVIGTNDVVVCNLQDTTYEWNYLRPSDANLLRMGMSIVTPIAFGLAISMPDQRVVSLDGDGSMIMGMGMLTTLGRYRPPNLLAIIFDNESYNSTGSSIPTGTGTGTDLAAAATASGVKNSVSTTDLGQFEKYLRKAIDSREHWIIVTKTEKESAKVPRPTVDGQENKYRFVRFVEKLKGVQILPTEEQKSFN